MTSPKNEGDDAAEAPRLQNPPGGQEINASDIFRGRAGATPPGEGRALTPPTGSQSDDAVADKAAKKPADGRPQIGEHSLEAKREGAGDVQPLINRTLPDRPQGVREANQAAIEHANMSTPTGVAKPVTIELRDGGGFQPMMRIKADDGRTVLYSRPGADGRDQFFKQDGGKLIQSDRLGQPIQNGETLAVRNIQVGRQFAPGDVPQQKPQQQLGDKPTAAIAKPAEGRMESPADKANAAKPSDAKPVDAKPADLKPVNDAPIPKGKGLDTPSGGGPLAGKPADAAGAKPVDQAGSGQGPAAKPGVDIDRSVTPVDKAGGRTALDPLDAKIQSRLLNMLSDQTTQSRVLDVLQVALTGGDLDPRVQKVFEGLNQDQIEQLRLGVVDGLEGGPILNQLDSALQGRLEQLLSLLSGNKDVSAGLISALPEGIGGREMLLAAAREIDRNATLLESQGRLPGEVMNQLVSRTMDGTSDSNTYSVTLDEKSTALINQLNSDMIRAEVPSAGSESLDADKLALQYEGDEPTLTQPGIEKKFDNQVELEDGTAIVDAPDDSPVTAYEDSPEALTPLPEKLIHHLETTESKHPEHKPHHEHEGDHPAVKAGLTAEELALLEQKRLEEEEKKKKEQKEEEERRLDKERKERERKNKRGSYRVRQGDSLLSIAQTQCNDGSVAPLIYDINRGQIPEKFHGVRRAAWLKVNQVLALPSENDVANYKRGPVRHAGIDMTVPAGTIAGAVPPPPGGFASPEAELAAKFGMQWGGGGLTKSDEEIKGSRTDDVKRKIRENIANVEQVLGPAKDKPAATTQSRIRYVCRIGDTLRSIALRHPALQDVKLWELLAVVNEISTEVNSKNDPIAKLARGQILFLPTPEDIQKWRAGTFYISSFVLHHHSYVEMARRQCPSCQRPTLVTALWCPGCAANMDGTEQELPATHDDKVAAVAAPVAESGTVSPRDSARSYARDIWSADTTEVTGLTNDAPSFSKINFPSSPSAGRTAGGEPSAPLYDPAFLEEDDDQRATSDNIAGYYAHLSKRGELGPLAPGVAASSPDDQELAQPEVETPTDQTPYSTEFSTSSSTDFFSAGQDDLERSWQEFSSDGFSNPNPMLFEEASTFAAPGADTDYGSDTLAESNVESSTQLETAVEPSPVKMQGSEIEADTSRNTGTKYGAASFSNQTALTGVPDQLNGGHPGAPVAGNSVPAAPPAPPTAPAQSQTIEEAPEAPPRRRTPRPPSSRSIPDLVQPSASSQQPDHQHTSSKPPYAQPADYQQQLQNQQGPITPQVQASSDFHREFEQPASPEGFAQPSYGQFTSSEFPVSNRPERPQPAFQQPAYYTDGFGSTQSSGAPAPQRPYSSGSSEFGATEYNSNTYQHPAESRYQPSPDLAVDPRDLQGQAPATYTSGQYPVYSQPQPNQNYQDFLQKPDYSDDWKQPQANNSFDLQKPADYEQPQWTQQSSSFDLQRPDYANDVSGNYYQAYDGSAASEPQPYLSPPDQAQQTSSYSSPPYGSASMDQSYDVIEEQGATQILRPDPSQLRRGPADQSATSILHGTDYNNPQSPRSSPPESPWGQTQQAPSPVAPVPPVPPPLPSYLRSNTKRPVPDVIYDYTAPEEPEPVAAKPPYYLSVNARILMEGDLDVPGKPYRVTLEGLADRWVPMAIYEFSAEVILHHIFDSTGRKKTRRIALPMKQALQLAENDLTTNWNQYIIAYAQGI